MADEEFKVVRFVFVGYRQDTKGGLIVGVAEVGPSLGDFRYYKPTKRLLLRTGAMYDIEASPGQISFGTAKYAGLYYDEAQRASWQAESEAAELEEALAKREKREAASKEAILKMLLPMRKAYQATNYRSRLAMEVQLLEALRRRPELGE